MRWQMDKTGRHLDKIVIVPRWVFIYVFQCLLVLHLSASGNVLIFRGYPFCVMDVKNKWHIYAP